MHKDVDLDRLRTFGFDMTLKNAEANLPFGGAKFGISINPTSYEKRFIRAIIEKATERLLFKKILNPDYYVPGPDVGSNSETMFWIYNKAAELNSLTQLPNIAAIVTGKPIEHDGCPGREDATSRGLLFLLNRYLKLSNLFESKNKIMLTIHGYGNVGMNCAALTLDEEFSRYYVGAVCDVNGGIYNRSGLDVKNLKQHYETYGTFASYDANLADQISGEELLELRTDILVLASMENQITNDNVDRIKAELVLEPGNECIIPTAQDDLDRRNIHVVTSIAAGVGGVTGSYCEWRRNRGERRHAVDYYDDLLWVHGELRKIMTTVIDGIYRISQERNLTLTQSAYVRALNILYEQLKFKHSW